MKSETREIIKTLLLGLVIMLLLPVGYRLWVLFSQPEVPPIKVPSSVEQVTNRVLLVRPLGQWSTTDWQAAPRVARWLEGHQGLDFPWDWPREKKTENFSAYSLAWAQLFEMCCVELTNEVTALTRSASQSAFNRGLEQKRYEQCTNQQACVLAAVRARILPARVALVEYSLDELWRWQTKTHEVEFSTMAEAAEMLATCAAEAARCKEKVDQLTVVVDECYAAIAKNKGLSAIDTALAAHFRAVATKSEQVDLCVLEADAFACLLQTIEEQRSVKETMP